MDSASKQWQLFLDDFLDDWLGIELSRPKVAMEGFEQEDGCLWCGETVRAFRKCPCSSRRLKWNRVFRLGAYAPPLSTSILQGKYSV